MKKTVNDIMVDFEDLFKDAPRFRLQVEHITSQWWNLIHKGLSNIVGIENVEWIRITRIQVFEGGVRLHYWIRPDIKTSKRLLINNLYKIRNIVVQNMRRKREHKLRKDVEQVCTVLFTETLDTCEVCGSGNSAQHALGMWIRTMCTDCVNGEYERGYNKRS